MIRDNENSKAQWGVLAVMAGILLSMMAVLSLPSKSQTMLDLGVGPITKIVIGGINFTNAKSFNMAVANTQFMSQTDAIVGGYNRTNFTVSVWCFPVTFSASTRGICGQYGFSGSRAWLIRWNNALSPSVLEVDYGTNTAGIGGTLITSSAYATGVWHHIVVAFDPKNVTSNSRCVLYVDGSNVTTFTTRAQATTNTNPIADSSSAIELGRANTVGTTIDGQVDEFAMINSIGTPTNFATAANKPTNTFSANYWLWWRSDNGLLVDEKRTNSLLNSNLVTQSSNVP